MMTIQNCDDFISHCASLGHDDASELSTSTMFSFLSCSCSNATFGSLLAQIIEHYRSSAACSTLSASRKRGWRRDSGVVYNCRHPGSKAQAGTDISNLRLSYFLRLFHLWMGIGTKAVAWVCETDDALQRVGR